MTADDLLTAPEAAARLKFPSVPAFRQFVRRHRVPKVYRGRSVLFELGVIEACLQRQSTQPAPMTSADIRALARQHARGVH